MIFFSLFILLLFIKSSNDGILEDGRGNVIGIKKLQEGKIYSFDLSLTQGKKKQKEKVEIQISGLEENPSDDLSKYENEDKNLKSYIDDMIEKLQSQEGTVLELPRHLGKNIELNWKQAMEVPWGILTIPFLIVLIKESDIRTKEKKKESNIKKDIFYQLPLFINQILLLLNSGMIFHDVILHIGNEYKKMERKNYFQVEIIKLCDEANDTHKNVVVLFNEFSRKSGVKELARVGNTILDSHYRGTDLVDKLDNERRNIWDNRKNQFKETGRIAETKLTFPLGLLLVVLIVITIAPAMMQI